MSWAYEYILWWSIVTYIGTWNEYISICILCWSSHLQYSTCKWCNHGMSRGQYTYVYVVKLLDRRQNLHLGRTDGARATEIDFWYGFLWCTHTGPNEWEMIRERETVSRDQERLLLLYQILLKYSIYFNKYRKTHFDYKTWNPVQYSTVHDMYIA